MIEHPFLPVARKMFDGHDPIWESSEPFDRRSAWLDLCQLALYQPREKLVQGELIRLGRGQVLASERWLGERWHWARSKVTRFLTLLKKMERISINPNHESNHVGAIITLCNYEVYNGVGTGVRTTNGASNEPEASQPRTKIEEREEGSEGKTPTKEANASLSGSGKPNRDGDVQRVWTHWVEVSGKAKAKLTPGRRTKIKTRLRHFTADELCAAIDGAHRNPFYLGDNERGTYYGDIETIFKTDEAVTKHMEWAEGSSDAQGATLTAIPGGLMDVGEQDEQRRAETKRQHESRQQAEARWMEAVLARIHDEPRAVQEEWAARVRPEFEHMRESVPEIYKKSVRRRVCELYAAEKGITIDQFHQEVSAA